MGNIEIYGLNFVAFHFNLARSIAVEYLGMVFVFLTYFGVDGMCWSGLRVGGARLRPAGPQETSHSAAERGDATEAPGNARLRPAGDAVARVAPFLPERGAQPDGGQRREAAVLPAQVQSRWPPPDRLLGRPDVARGLRVPWPQCRRGFASGSRTRPRAGRRRLQRSTRTARQSQSSSRLSSFTSSQSLSKHNSFCMIQYEDHIFHISMIWSYNWPR